MSNPVQDLEIAVDIAGLQLNTVKSRLDEVEKNLIEGGDDEVNNVAVLELLESVTEVKNEYTNLRKDIKEVQQLQKEMSESLIYQMRTMRQTFNILQKKVGEIHNITPKKRDKNIKQ